MPKLINDIVAGNVSENIKIIYFTLAYLSIIYILNKFSDKPFQRLIKLEYKAKNIIKGYITGFISISTYYLILTYFSYFTFTHFKLNYIATIQILFLSFVVALTEELVFRDFLLRKFLKHYSENKSIFLSSYIYAQLHFLRFDLSMTKVIIPLISLFLIGFILSKFYLKNNIFYNVGIHWAWIVAISYINQNDILKINSDIYLTGGFYPPSGLFACFILLSTVVCMSINRNKNNLS